MEHIKLSTSRDFRINTTVLQELTEQAGDTSSGDSDDTMENQVSSDCGPHTVRQASSRHGPFSSHRYFLLHTASG